MNYYNARFLLQLVQTKLNPPFEIVPVNSLLYYLLHIIILYIVIHVSYLMEHCVLASVVGDVQLLHSRFRSWLGHKYIFSFVHIAALHIVVLYLHELEVVESFVHWRSNYFNVFDIQFEV